MEMTMSEGWEAKVYCMPDRESGLQHAEWRLLRDKVLERDRYTCLRCDTRFKVKSKLSVHHLVPRANGGTNVMHNLVTLCHPCHDLVEVNDLRTRAAIMGSFETDTKIITQDYAPTDWHEWVYGGARNPILRKRMG